MNLKNQQTDDLLARWQMLIDGYLEDVKKLRNDIIKIDKVRNELLLIREELVSRNIQVDQGENDIESQNAGRPT